MNWTQAIARNRAALIALAAAIAALIGGRDALGPVARGLRNAALALLRPAESAARRLIIATARGLSVTLPPPRPFPSGLAVGGMARRMGGDASERTPAFPLFDRWKRFRPLFQRAQPLGVPRIRAFWSEALPAAPAPAATPRRAAADPAEPMDITGLRRRFRALEAALADLPRQARRLARWRARRALSPDRPARQPLRPGRPPGLGASQGSAADLVLTECHGLACDALRGDTS